MGLFTKSYRSAEVIQKDMDTLTRSLSSCDGIRKVHAEVKCGWSNWAFMYLIVDGREYVMKIEPFEWP